MVTLSDLITKVRRRANLEQSSNVTASEQFITDAEITDYLNEGGAELHEELTLSNENYSVTTWYTQVTSGNTFDLPSDFYKLKGIHKGNGDGYLTLREYDTTQMNDFQNPFYSVATVNPNNCWYNLLNTTVDIRPTQQATGTYRVLYVPQFTNLVNTSDAITLPQNWTDYMVAYAALQCRIKENIGSTQELGGQVEHMKRRIIDAAARRGQPRTAKRIRTAFSRWYR